MLINCVYTAYSPLADGQDYTPVAELRTLDVNLPNEHLLQMEVTCEIKLPPDSNLAQLAVTFERMDASTLDALLRSLRKDTFQWTAALVWVANNTVVRGYFFDAPAWLDEFVLAATHAVTDLANMKPASHAELLANLEDLQEQLFPVKSMYDAEDTLDEEERYHE